MFNYLNTQALTATLTKTAAVSNAEIAAANRTILTNSQRGMQWLSNLRRPTHARLMAPRTMALWE
jgi:hypothetical protein